MSSLTAAPAKYSIYAYISRTGGCSIDFEERPHDDLWIWLGLNTWRNLLMKCHTLTTPQPVQVELLHVEGTTAQCCKRQNTS